jgi:hypothetical protein
MSHKLNSGIAVIGIADIGNSAAIRFESALKASGRSPRFVMTRLSTSQLRSCEAAAIVGRGFTGVFAKGGGK